ncbi:MAG: SIMPL domain-containing protein [Caldilineales bacterium]|nr:SIMPL domain-containing protein [Caldilineales bacterium]
MSTKLKYLVLVMLLGALALWATGCTLPVEAGGGPAIVAAPAESIPKTISVSGAGVVSAPPDVAYLDLGVEIIDTDPAKAVADNTEKMAAVMDALTGQGIEAKDIATTNYSVWMEQVVDKDGVPTGETRYHVVNSVRATLSDLSKSGEVLQAALAAGANTVGGISFGISDPATLQTQARDLAIANAQAKAEQLAAGFGATLGPIRQVSEYATGIPLMKEAYASTVDGRGGGGPVPISTGEFSVQVELQAVYDIQ